MPWCLVELLPSGDTSIVRSCYSLVLPPSPPPSSCLAVLLPVPSPWLRLYQLILFLMRAIDSSCPACLTEMTGRTTSLAPADSEGSDSPALKSGETRSEMKPNSHCFIHPLQTFHLAFPRPPSTIPSPSLPRLCVPLPFSSPSLPSPSSSSCSLPSFKALLSWTLVSSPRAPRMHPWT